MVRYIDTNRRWNENTHAQLALWCNRCIRPKIMHLAYSLRPKFHFI